MSAKISRRDFLKLSGAGAAAATVLTGCGPVARHVTRRPYSRMPEFNPTGKSTYYATTCRDCPAGCGLVVRTFEGRAIKAEGNPQHPVNQGKICSRGLTGVQGLYNPDRITAPLRRTARGEAATEDMDWNAAVETVRAGLGSGSAFLLGGSPDHLFDLVTELAEAVGAPAPVRYSTLNMLSGRATLLQAMQQTFGQARMPVFDVANSNVVISFGSTLLSEWLSPLFYARQFRQMRQNALGRGQFFVFSPFQSTTAGTADDWFPIAPGSEGVVAQALGRLVVEARGGSAPAPFNSVDVNAAAQTAGVDLARLQQVASLFANARQAVSLPGGEALGQAGGLEAAQAILALNQLSATPGLSFGAGEELETSDSLQPVRALIERMRSGEVNTLFIHGVNPLFELPPSLGFDDALASVDQVISFASFPDETALQSDFVFPDHTGLESFGYQRLMASDRPLISAMQPVVTPLYNTRATADVLLAAAGSAGLPYSDEVEYIQSRLQTVVEGGAADGLFQAGDVPTFWSLFLQNGGWWTQGAQVETVGDAGASGVTLPEFEPLEEGQFHFITYAGKFGDGSVANRPWIQETPDPLTTVAWNTYVLMSPVAAEELGIHNNDVIRMTSNTGWMEAIVYVYPAIRPDTLAMPFGQGHSALGRWAAGRGVNPAMLLTNAGNAAGDLAFAGTRVRVETTGRRRPLATMEDREGVYGHEE